MEGRRHVHSRIFLYKVKTLKWFSVEHTFNPKKKKKTRLKKLP